MSEQTTKGRAVVLLSGGMDSATTLAIAADQGYELYALSFRYGQRHSAELDAAMNLARMFGAVEHKIVDLDLSSIGGSALTDMDIAVPTEPGEGIPVTYVPARNTIFLSIALGWAEVLKSTDIFIGVNAVDYSGYPDCRQEFIEAYETMANLATKAGVEGHKLTIHTPLIDLTKADIILRGQDLGLDYRVTVSCYAADEQGQACGVCDACRLRRRGFEDAGVADQTIYR
jgi:7-cyano-7-deazaguanine synthase